MILLRLGLICAMASGTLWADEKSKTPSNKKLERARLTARRHLRRVKAVGTPEVKLRLFSDREQIAAGKTFRLGLHFTVGSGWHIYGNKPGEGYLPTKVKVQLPAGFKLVSTRWPKPEMVDGVDPGKKIPAYHKSVLVVATVQAPPKLDSGKKHAFSASGQWQFCHEDGICRLGKGELKLAIKAGGGKASRLAPLFPVVATK